MIRRTVLGGMSGGGIGGGGAMDGPAIITGGGIPPVPPSLASHIGTGGAPNAALAFNPGGVAGDMCILTLTYVQGRNSGVPPGPFTPATSLIDAAGNVWVQVPVDPGNNNQIFYDDAAFAAFVTRFLHGVSMYVCASLIAPPLLTLTVTNPPDFIVSISNTFRATYDEFTGLVATVIQGQGSTVEDFSGPLVSPLQTSAFATGRAVVFALFENSPGGAVGAGFSFPGGVPNCTAEYMFAVPGLQSPDMTPLAPQNNFAGIGVGVGY